MPNIIRDSERKLRHVKENTFVKITPKYPYGKNTNQLKLNYPHSHAILYVKLTLRIAETLYNTS